MKVNQPAVALVKKFEHLSDGWSGGLLGVGGAFWLVALTCFTLAINDPLMAGYDAAFGNPPGTNRIFHLTGMAALALLPFPLAVDIAGTSTCCDELMDELNQARIKHGKSCHATIQCLETALKQLVRQPSFFSAIASDSHHCLAFQNRGQGLGFVLAGTVIDKRSLTTNASSLPVPSPPLSACSLGSLRPPNPPLWKHHEEAGV